MTQSLTDLRVLVITHHVATGRYLRVTSLYPITAVRCFAPNSHDRFRFVKQAAKGSLQLAINSSERPLQEIMVKLLNKIQPQVNACYTSRLGYISLPGGEARVKRRRFH
ncbi:hypothetical protein ACN38_g5769 [Penicillium nordicum]|uniref:Uncharacterized protein n=1 Tax=Penicillium nordicum TaxID=229535 RepID=A0A0M9WFW1_9EURO|nr:hypothetical protein ACN38_g5769 [Penicillium nordicum]